MNDALLLTVLAGLVEDHDQAYSDEDHPYQRGYRAALKSVHDIIVANRDRNRVHGS